MEKTRSQASDLNLVLKGSLTLTGVVTLEFIVAAIMLIGGTLLTIMAEARLLGLIHALLGGLGLPMGYALWARKSWAFNSTLALNIAGTTYSSLSEMIVVNGQLLAPGALQGSIIGTLVAVIISLTIVLLLLGKRKVFSKRDGLK